MGSFKLLFSISFTHQYFGNNRFNLRVEPSIDLQRFIENTGLLLLKRNDGILIYYDGSGEDILKSYSNDEPDGLIFDFIAFTNEPTFYNYTKLPRTMSLTVFENANLKNKKGIIVLQQSVKPIEKPLHIARNSAVSICAIKIAANAGTGLFDENGEITPRTFSIHFDSRETYWTYFVKKEHYHKEVIIEDYNKEITFSKKDEIYKVSGSDYQAFMSDKPIPLIFNSENIFQLKEKRGSKCRVLMKRLPIASPVVVHKGKKGKQDIQVSEIFINH